MSKELDLIKRGIKTMITEPVKGQSMTIDECFERLETLFKAYQNDSEFNYQLISMNSAFNQLKDKVFELKNIEKELGIDLITLYKVLDQGIYYKNMYYTGHDKLYITNGEIYNYARDKWVYLKDYGKTWALTKEELK